MLHETFVNIFLTLVDPLTRRNPEKVNFSRFLQNFSEQTELEWINWTETNFRTYERSEIERDGIWNEKFEF